MGVVNDSVLQLTSHLQTHLGEVEERVGSVEESEDDLKKRVSAFESHPPTIGQVCRLSSQSALVVWYNLQSMYMYVCIHVCRSIHDIVHVVCTYKKCKISLISSPSPYASFTLRDILWRAIVKKKKRGRLGLKHHVR